MLAEYLSREFEGHHIEQRNEDGYIDATAMCKINKSKNFKDWHRNKSTKEFLEALSTKMEIIPSVLVESKRGGNDRGGSWIHPEVAIHLAMWINPMFAVQVTHWVTRFISGDIGLIPEITQRHDEVNDTKTLSTVTSVSKGVHEDILRQLHAQNTKMMDAMFDKLDKKIKEISVTAEEKAELVRHQQRKRKLGLTFGLTDTQVLTTSNIDPKITIKHQKMLQPGVFALVHQISHGIVSMSKHLAPVPRIEAVRKAVSDIFEVDSSFVALEVSGMQSSNHIRLYTVICKYVKARLSPTCEYSTEMPLNHAYIYSKNFNAYMQNFGYKGNNLADDICEFSPDVKSFAFSKDDDCVPSIIMRNLITNNIL
jgi:hypothetical protein